MFSFFLFMLWVALILQVDLFASTFPSLSCLSGLIWAVARQKSVCYYLSPAGLYEDRATGVPSEYQADVTERILFFRSAHTISTNSRDLRRSVGGARNQGWSRNDNAHCSPCTECSLASFIFCAGISVFCPLLFMPSFFHPVCWPLPRLTPPSGWLTFSCSLFSLKQQLLGPPRVVSEALHHHHHRSVISINKPH